MDVPARWSDLLRRSEEELPLDEAALLISASAQPGLNVDGQLRRLDELAGRVGGTDADAVCRFLFGEFGLRGDRDHYDDPPNSYLDRVLDRGRGIPVSLSVLLIEVGRRVGLNLEAVGMPGHFLVRDPADPDRLIDAFDQGRRLDHEGCERLMRRATRSASPLTRAMLAATGKRAVLARMLANLDASFARRNDYKSLAWVSSLRLMILDAPAGDRVQLAGRLTALGRFDYAADVLEELAGALSAEAEADQLRGDAKGIRARLN